MQLTTHLFLIVMAATVMCSPVHAQPGFTEVTPKNAGEVGTLFNFSVASQGDGSGRLRLTVSGRTATVVAVSANLVIGSTQSPKLRASLPINEKKTPQAPENAPTRSWYVEIEAAPDTAAEVAIEVFFDPTDKPAGNGRLFRVIVKEFLKKEKP